ncbi:Bys1 family protein [Pyrenophora tritici-repentis]|uniref:Uncharacterized protein n=2 Tax=Pyrenophora tritici-repentis TaxID=45151 RepID=A0A2W1GUJ2_9PLEO|nr:uncharacterized protein PTRG_02669 [Pyrenophora tritici-repentis Pt-1C-BFP]KAA8623269.1 hypothetical protein PtrV1_04575 [Pyrenophora tritici-repentis]EDU45192.1 conserved hypothetical protein [Pyrenophora tritici-repentis Pt-1C-BFP]KAF7452266.1 hypothetical protein A1F99_040430 [Pyrenophora tritici-repentis]KAF7574613.1 hypothetical protein PtrM4_062370 [Pyrenophora tritici-repentis]KAG9386609.1 hypothetical protein A1F94_003359 [Pyrenophora tritici-repentis]
MRLSTLVATVAMFANTALAAYATVYNNCKFTVFVTSVQTDQSPVQMILPKGLYVETMKVAKNGVGVAVQVMKSQDGLYNGKPVLTMAYSLDPKAGLYYSLSTAHGFDFKGENLRIHNSGGAPLEQIVWVGEPKPDYSAIYHGTADLNLNLCDTFVE